MAAKRLHAGDQVVHPRYGFGVVEELVERDHDGTAVKYYGVRLADGGMLSVPAAQAEALGLRRVVNGLSTTLASLRGRVSPLPDNARLRVAELVSRWDSPDPAALAAGVRDLIGYARRYRLSAGDKRWLERACERLSVEAARVDSIELAAARATLTAEVERLRTR